MLLWLTEFKHKNRQKHRQLKLCKAGDMSWPLISSAWIPHIYQSCTYYIVMVSVEVRMDDLIVLTDIDCWLIDWLIDWLIVCKGSDLKHTALHVSIVGQCVCDRVGQRESERECVCETERVRQRERERERESFSKQSSVGSVSKRQSDEMHCKWVSAVQERGTECTEGVERRWKITALYDRIKE